MNSVYDPYKKLKPSESPNYMITVNSQFNNSNQCYQYNNNYIYIPNNNHSNHQLSPHGAYSFPTLPSYDNTGLSSQVYQQSNNIYFQNNPPYIPAPVNINVYPEQPVMIYHSNQVVMPNQQGSAFAPVYNTYQSVYK